VVEMGRHETLMQRAGLYSQLYARQVEMVALPYAASCTET